MQIEVPSDMYDSSIQALQILRILIKKKVLQTEKLLFLWDTILVKGAILKQKIYKKGMKRLII